MYLRTEKVDVPEDREGGEAAPSWRTDLPRRSSVKLQVLAAKRVERKEREKLEGEEKWNHNDSIDRNLTQRGFNVGRRRRFEMVREREVAESDSSTFRQRDRVGLSAEEAVSWAYGLQSKRWRFVRFWASAKLLGQ
ncbi:hypothetical protein F2Q69_00054363 [Brassica cretica]|uniref:Uncharacterized protein n=1 Tax=Brassica cretica TaxID=69181 RepID=A0A8S9N928_BRACR|nr:hypothetical protein F2Q69_00054363 [Brassica cretica]